MHLRQIMLYGASYIACDPVMITNYAGKVVILSDSEYSACRCG